MTSYRTAGSLGQFIGRKLGFDRFGTWCRSRIERLPDRLKVWRAAPPTAPAPPPMDWGKYASDWESIKKIVPIEDSSISEAERPHYLRVIGDEWGTKGAVDRFVSDFVAPFIDKSSVAAEIGCGGGRVALRVAPLCAHFHCLDVEQSMLAKCAEVLSGASCDYSCHVLDRSLPTLPLGDQSVDLVFSFDTMVHLHHRVVLLYLREASRILRPGGSVAFHVATAETELGRRHLFDSLSENTLPGTFGSFEYICTKMMINYAADLGLSLRKLVSGESDNFYYARDCIALFQKAV